MMPEERSFNDDLLDITLARVNQLVKERKDMASLLNRFLSATSYVETPGELDMNPCNISIRTIRRDAFEYLKTVWFLDDRG